MDLSHTFYYPLVGSKYKNGINGVKLLILGESHYCDEGCEVCGIKSGFDCSEFTIGVLERFINYKRRIGAHESWMTTFTRFTNVLFGEAIPDSKLIEFWDSIIFYNYVQSSTKGPRISPSFEQFDESKDSFFNILSIYKPDLIIVWGKRLWENLPDNGKWGNENILDGKYGKFYYYNTEGKKIPSFCVHHPSTSYYNYNYTKYFDEIFKIITKNK